MSVDTRKIIFIGGCPRSGTTLLASMLGSPESHLAIPEMDIKFRLLEGLTGAGEQLSRLQILKLIRQQLKLWDINKSLSTLDSVFPDQNHIRSILDWIILYYSREKYPKREHSVWIEHDPENIKVVQSLLRIYPEAKFVYILRDGRAVANSALKLPWGPNSVVRSAEWWLTYLGFGFSAMHAYQGRQLFMLRYEDLVFHTRETLAAICSICQLNFSESMIHGTGFKVPDHLKRSHNLIGSPPDPSRVTAWKKELTARQIELFEWVTKDVLSYLGYELIYGNNVRPPNLREKTAYHTKEWIYELKHRIFRSLKNVYNVKI